MAQVAIGLERRGLNRDRLAERPLRRGKVAFECIRHAQVRKDLRRTRLECQAAFVTIDSLVEVLSLERHDAESGPRFRMLRMAGEKPAIARIRIGIAPGSLMFPAPAKIVHNRSPDAARSDRARDRRLVRPWLRARAAPRARGQFGECPSDALEHLIPVVKLRLLEHSNRRVPRRVFAAGEPAPIGVD